MRITVTGAHGFIGSNMVAFLKKQGHSVRGVDIATRTERMILYKQADEDILSDLRNEQAVYEALKGADAVIHLASDMGGVGYFTAHNYQPFLNNMQMDINVLRVCEELKIKRLFYSSSACSYPVHMQMTEGEPIMLREDMLFPANADLMYGWEKLMMLMLCKESPIDARVGIFHTIYGPYQEVEGERMKFPTAIATKAIAAQLEQRKSVEIWGNGEQIRTLLYIDDALEKIYRVLTADSYSGAVNIGSDELVTVGDVATTCMDIVGIQNGTLTYNLEKPSGVLARASDNTQFNTEYGEVPQTSMREGFTRLIQWIYEQKRS